MIFLLPRPGLGGVGDAYPGSRACGALTLGYLLSPPSWAQDDDEFRLKPDTEGKGEKISCYHFRLWLSSWSATLMMM